MQNNIELRQLLYPDEFDSWLDLCALAFAAKGTARAHFEGHYRHDPHADPTSILVLVDSSSGRMLSTLRVFVRRIHLPNGELVTLGGIGEVGSHPDARGRGFASMLLSSALTLMKDRHYTLGGLHSSQLADFYEKLGWTKIPRSIVRTSASSLLQSIDLLPDFQIAEDNVSLFDNSELFLEIRVSNDSFRHFTAFNHMFQFFFI
jgi:GNAT superfamily N-acetyltransferase